MSAHISITLISGWLSSGLMTDVSEELTAITIIITHHSDDEGSKRL
jgi:hypothetical protein